jgi:hypothetical protein
MELQGIGRRRYKRVFYSADDHMIGFFLFPGQKDEMLVAQIMNVSVGGLHFTIKRNEMLAIKKGDHLILTKVMGNSPLRMVSHIEIEIKWILDHPMMKHVGFGGEFCNLSDMTRLQISQCIESVWNNTTQM